MYSVSLSVRPSVRLSVRSFIYLSLSLTLHTHTHPPTHPHPHTHIYIYIWIHMCVFVCVREREREMRERDRECVCVCVVVTSSLLCIYTYTSKSRPIFNTEMSLLTTRTLSSVCAKLLYLDCLTRLASLSLSKLLLSTIGTKKPDRPSWMSGIFFFANFVNQ